MKNTSRSAAGFTLVELVIVVVILAILAAVVVPAVGDKVDAGRAATARIAMQQLSDAMNKYHSDTNAWPSNSPTAGAISTSSAQLYGYDCLYKNSGIKSNWNGPYLEHGVLEAGKMQVATPTSTEGMIDPWQHPYWVFTFGDGYEGEKGAILLLCAGPNGIVDSVASDVYTETPKLDDLVQVVARKLSVDSSK
jgi:general secretion pathway protein G